MFHYIFNVLYILTKLVFIWLLKFNYIQDVNVINLFTNVINICNVS